MSDPGPGPFERFVDRVVDGLIASIYKIPAPLLGIGLALGLCWIIDIVSHGGPVDFVCEVDCYDTAAVSDDGQEPLSRLQADPPSASASASASTPASASSAAASAPSTQPHLHAVNPSFLLPL